MGGLIVLYIAIAAIYCIAWGIGTCKILDIKGRDYDSTKWFFAGFFFGILAVLVALAFPQENSDKFVDSFLSDAATQANNEKMIRDGGWICSKCGKINASYVGTCGCGNSK